jgi:hypothetical protein
LNADYAKIWPNITIKRDAPADAKEWEGARQDCAVLAQTRHGRLSGFRSKRAIGR